MDWEEVKRAGSSHYKNGGVEPIDLYRSLGTLRDFCLSSIIKYAARNVSHGPDANPVSVKDMDKIKHYADMLIVACGENRKEPTLE